MMTVTMTTPDNIIDHNKIRMKEWPSKLQLQMYVIKKKNFFADDVDDDAGDDNEGSAPPCTSDKKVGQKKVVTTIKITNTTITSCSVMRMTKRR